MGNDFGAFPRFPRPEDPDIPVPEIRPTSPDPYARGGAFYRPSSTTVSTQTVIEKKSARICEFN